MQDEQQQQSLSASKLSIKERLKLYKESKKKSPSLTSSSSLSSKQPSSSVSSAISAKNAPFVKDEKNVKEFIQPENTTTRNKYSIPINSKSNSSSAPKTSISQCRSSQSKLSSNLLSPSNFNKGIVGDIQIFQKEKLDQIRSANKSQSHSSISFISRDENENAQINPSINDTNPEYISYSSLSSSVIQSSERHMSSQMPSIERGNEISEVSSEKENMLILQAQLIQQCYRLFEIVSNHQQKLEKLESDISHGLCEYERLQENIRKNSEVIEIATLLSQAEQLKENLGLFLSSSETLIKKHKNVERLLTASLLSLDSCQISANHM